jgi:hypothetical protein
MHRVLRRCACDLRFRADADCLHTRVGRTSANRVRILAGSTPVMPAADCPERVRGLCDSSHVIGEPRKLLAKKPPPRATVPPVKPGQRQSPLALKEIRRIVVPWFVTVSAPSTTAASPRHYQPLRMRRLHTLILASAVLLLALLAPAHGAITSTYPAGLQHLESAASISSTPIRLERSFADTVGYHRTLVTRVTVPDDAMPKPIGGRCLLLLKETLPRTLYFDLYQLAEWTRFQRSTAAADAPDESSFEVFSLEDVELERSSADSKEYSVWILADHAKWSSHLASDGTQTHTATLKVPIHARYQAARLGGGHALASMPPPSVFLSCDNDGGVPGDFSTVRPFVRQTYERTSNHTVSLEVPVGDLADLPLVRWGTLLVTLTASLALFLVVQWTARRGTTDVSNQKAE